MTELQLFAALDPATEAALRSSIQRFGVIVPVVKDQDGRIIDGHHRSRIADELGVEYRFDVFQVADDDEAREVATTLNTDRRHLEPSERRPQVKHLIEAGHAPAAVAGALGVSRTTVRRDVEHLGREAKVEVPERVVGIDGKSYPSTRPSTMVDTDDVGPMGPPTVGDVLGVDGVARIRAEVADRTGIPFTNAMRSAVGKLAAFARSDAPEQIARYVPDLDPQDKRSLLDIVTQAELALASIRKAADERRMEVVK